MCGRRELEQDNTLSPRNLNQRVGGLPVGRGNVRRALGDAARRFRDAPTNPTSRVSGLLRILGNCRAARPTSHACPSIRFASRVHSPSTPQTDAASGHRSERVQHGRAPAPQLSPGARHVLARHASRAGRVAPPTPTRLETAAFDAWNSKLDLMEGTRFVDNPHDHGGATKRGITLRTLRRFVKGATVNTLKNATPSQLRAWSNEIFRHYGLNPIKSDGVAVFLADAEWGGFHDYNLTHVLQAVGSKTKAFMKQPSGLWSDATIRALNSLDPSKLLDAMFHEVKRARASSASGKNQGVFSRGWLNRANTRYVQCKILVGDVVGAARWLNGRDQAEMKPVLAWLSPAEKAALHGAALSAGSGLGADSAIARHTETSAPTTRTTQQGEENR